MIRFGGYAFALLCIFVGCSQDDSNRTTKDSPFPISISRATTWVTEPTRADGSVDFILAWNQWGKDQFPQRHNIVLNIIELADESVFKSDETQQVLRCLAKSPSEITRQPLRGISSFSSEELIKFRQRLWISDDNPGLADCLQKNAGVFQAINGLVSQQGYFLPVTESQGLPKHFVFADLSLLVEMGHLVDGLSVRATLNFGELRPSAGVEDLLTIHHLARTVIEHGHPLEIVTARKWETAALDVERALIQDGRLTREHKQDIATFRKNWKPPVLSTQAVVNYSRLSTLAVYCELARKDPIAIETILNEYTKEKDLLGRIWSNLPITDWNSGARLIVTQFDQLDSAFAHGEFGERKLSVARWEKQLAVFVREFREKTRSLESSGQLPSGASPSDINSEDIAKLILGLTVPSLPILLDGHEQSSKEHEELCKNWAALQ